jgi:antitoxin (DNA-binding transcriptional repressor) of toxin-antitoxin stability system
MRVVATFRISEADAVRDFAGLLERVRSGNEVVIESGDLPVAVLHPPATPGRTIEEALVLLPDDSTAVMDEDFARDIEDAIAAHREPLNPPSWN